MQCLPERAKETGEKTERDMAGRPTSQGMKLATLDTGIAHAATELIR